MVFIFICYYSYIYNLYINNIILYCKLYFNNYNTNMKYKGIKVWN